MCEFQLCGAWTKLYLTWTVKTSGRNLDCLVHLCSEKYVYFFVINNENSANLPQKLLMIFMEQNDVIIDEQNF